MGAPIRPPAIRPARPIPPPPPRALHCMDCGQPGRAEANFCHRCGGSLIYGYKPSPPEPTPPPIVVQRESVLAGVDWIVLVVVGFMALMWLTTR